MGVDVSALSNYTEQNKQALITKAVLTAKTIKMMVLMAGIKSSETINIADTDAVFQVGGTCGFNASGTTAITQRTVTIGKIKVQEALCPKTLESKYTQVLLQSGSKYDGLPFEQVYAELKTELIAKQLEIGVWQGDTTSGSAALNKFDGLIKLIGYISSTTGIKNVNAITGIGTVSTAVGTAVVTGVGTTFVTQGIAVADKLRINGAYYTVLTVDTETQITLTANAGVLNAAKSFTFVVSPTGNSPSTNFTTPYTTFDSTNAIAIMQSIYSTIPVEVLGDSNMRVFIGMDLYRTWTNALTTANLFHYTAESADFELTIPGTNIKVVAVNGLNGTNKIFAIRTSNMYYGTDMLNEEEKFEIFFAKEADEVRYTADWKSGCNVAFLPEITQFTLAA